MSEVNLEGGGTTKVTLAGDVAYRSSKPQSRTVMSFLAFLKSSGFEASPEPVGTGFTSDGREMLTYIEGASPQPSAWSDQAAYSVGVLLRQLHSLSATCRSRVNWTPSRRLLTDLNNATSEGTVTRMPCRGVHPGRIVPQSWSGTRR